MVKDAFLLFELAVAVKHCRVDSRLSRRAGLRRTGCVGDGSAETVKGWPTANERMAAKPAFSRCFDAKDHRVEHSGLIESESELAIADVAVCWDGDLVWIIKDALRERNFSLKK